MKTIQLLQGYTWTNYSLHYYHSYYYYKKCLKCLQCFIKLLTKEGLESLCDFPVVPFSSGIVPSIRHKAISAKCDKGRYEWLGSAAGWLETHGLLRNSPEEAENRLIILTNLLLCVYTIFIISLKKVQEMFKSSAHQQSSMKSIMIKKTLFLSLTWKNKHLKSSLILLILTDGFPTKSRFLSINRMLVICCCN